MAGTGNAAGAGVTAHVGAQGPAVDEGAFRESLKASVGAGMTARAVVQGMPAVAGMKPGLVSTAMEAASAVKVENAGDSSAPGPSPIVLQTRVGEDSAVVVSAPAVTVRSGDVAGPIAATVGSKHSSGAALEFGAGAKAVGSAPFPTAVEGVKELKDGAASAGKKIKTAEKGGATPPIEIAAVDGVVAATAPGAVIQVQGAGLPMPLVAQINEGHVPAPATEASGKIAKGGVATGAVKATGRDVKKVDGEAPVTGKAEAGAGVLQVTAGSGAGHVAVKDAAPVVGAQGVVGAVAPAGMAVSHGGVAGAAGGRVAANVDAVSTAGAQGAGVVPEVKTMAATPNLLEVGIDGGTHGWLRVRAELGQTGEVTASIVAGSAGQADTLRRELPAMSTYLAGESLGVSSLAVNAAGAAAGTQDSAMSLGAGAQSGGDGRAQQGSVGAESAEMGGARSSEDGAIGLEFSGAELPAAVYANGSGSWLSVRV